MNRLQPGVIRRICGSAFIVAGMVVSAAFPRLAFADEPVLGTVTVIQHTPVHGDQDFHYRSEVPDLGTAFHRLF